jgi:hypothetical protein
MKVIGDRVSILKKDDVLSIVILPKSDKRKMGIMFLWLLAWTVCGIIVFVNYFQVSDKNSKLFIIIYLSFWAYFEYKIMRAFMWRKYGKEKLWISDGVVHYQQEINKRGKIQEFDYSLIQDLKLIEREEFSFSEVINSSFWIKGGERIEFACQHKVIRFGMQLEDKEAKAIVHEITQFVFKDEK